MEVDIMLGKSVDGKLARLGRSFALQAAVHWFIEISEQSFFLSRSIAIENIDHTTQYQSIQILASARERS